MKNAKFIPLKVLAVLLLSASSFARLSNGNRALRNGYLLESTQHDGLYDQSILNLYNSHRNVKGVAQENFYAPIYFRNLKNNIGNNLYGTCNFVAMGMLLSFWDTYWDDSIIPEQYEMPPMFFDGTLTRDTDSPGIRREFGPIFENLPNGYADFANLRSNQWILDNFFQIKLIDMWDSYIEDLNDSDLTMSARNMCRFLFDYLRSGPGFNRSDFAIDYDTVSYSGESELREAVIENVTNGVPVLVGIGHTSDDDYGSHTAIAYDYDEEKDEIYFNMGWGNNASHVTMETFGYSSINNILSIRFNTEHQHTYNYKQFYFGGMNQLCSCEYSKLCSIEEERTDTDIAFKWSYLRKEKWDGIHGQNDNTVFSVSYYDDFDIVRPITTSGTGYVLNGQEAASLAQCSHYTAKVVPECNCCPECADKTFVKSFSHSVSTEYKGSLFAGDYGFGISNQPQTESVSTAIGNDVLTATVSNGKYNGSTIELDSDLNGSFIELRLDSTSGFLRIDHDINGQFNLLFEGDGGWVVGSGDGTDYLVRNDSASGNAYIEFFRKSNAVRIAPADGSVFIGDMFFWNALPTSGYEMPYDPSLWNRSSVVGSLNCYSYAINNQTDDFDGDYLWYFQGPGFYAYHDCYTRVPFMGAPEGYPKKEIYFVEQDFASYSAAHGAVYKFEEIGRFDVCEPFTYKVAFVYKNNMDDYEWGGFHWYRQNPDGTWSHKNGALNCTNLDDSGELITDPQIADRGEYGEFISYYKVSPWNNIYLEG
ncbi:MAG: hypothetical protein MJ241_04560 [Bacilli bacterium]|nr:hypothetical protein [Bacilli bacterium]